MCPLISIAYLGRSNLTGVHMTPSSVLGQALGRFMFGASTLIQIAPPTGLLPRCSLHSCMTKDCRFLSRIFSLGGWGHATQEKLGILETVSDAT